MRDAEIDQMLTRTSFRGLLPFDVIRKAKDALGGTPKQGLGTTAICDFTASPEVLPWKIRLCHSTVGQAEREMTLAFCDLHAGPRATKVVDEWL